MNIKTLSMAACQLRLILIRFHAICTGAAELASATIPALAKSISPLANANKTRVGLIETS